MSIGNITSFLIISDPRMYLKWSPTNNMLSKHTQPFRFTNSQASNGKTFFFLQLLIKHTFFSVLLFLIFALSVRVFALLFATNVFVWKSGIKLRGDVHQTRNAKLNQLKGFGLLELNVLVVLTSSLYGKEIKRF
jgi:hypothetical protein